MAILRNNNSTHIKVHLDEDILLANAVGDLNLLYIVAPGGVSIDPMNYNLHTIEVFQDTGNASLHGLFRKK